MQLPQSVMDCMMMMLAGVDVGGKGPIKIWTLSKDAV
jgi:hypothetical protein